MTKAMPRVMITLSLLAALAACNTIEGAGADMQNAGAAVSSEARKTANDL